MNKKYKIVGVCQIYNEIRKGNLKRFVKYIKPLVDELVVYDDGSTDGSYEYMLEQTPYLIRGLKNDFANERSHKQLILDQTLRLSPDFILWLDTDEVLTANAAENLQNLCTYCDKNQIDGLAMHELNIWRSNTWRRLDSLFNDGWFVRLWRVTPDISFKDIKPGLHQTPYPSTIEKVERTNDLKVLHYGFASKRALSFKYLVYKSHGQCGYEMLDRLISEEQLVLEKVPQNLFPEGLWVEAEKKPEKMSFDQSLAYVEGYRSEVFKPGFSIICPIDKDLAWLKFIHKQINKYTDMEDKELIFVLGSKVSGEILKYLENNSLHFYRLNNKVSPQEWYVNDVFRKYNLAASKARGDYIIFLHSDMALTADWFTNLWKNYNGDNCLSSRLLEAGKEISGEYGIEINFGEIHNSFQEEKMIKLASSISLPVVKDGGLYIPLFIKKEHFNLVNGFPEGNVIADTDIFNPQIARKGQSCINGYEVLIKKLTIKGIKHQTSFDSIVYHFQHGESIKY